MQSISVLVLYFLWSYDPLFGPYRGTVSEHNPAAVDTHPTDHSNLTIPPDNRRMMRPAPVC